MRIPITTELVASSSDVIKEEHNIQVRMEGEDKVVATIEIGRFNRPKYNMRGREVAEVGLFVRIEGMNQERNEIHIPVREYDQ